MLRTVQATEGALPKEKDLVIQFVNSLDQARWGRMKSEFENAAKHSHPSMRSMAYPDTLDQAFSLAARRVEPDGYGSIAPTHIALSTSMHKQGGKSKSKQHKKHDQHQQPVQMTTPPPPPAISNSTSQPVNSKKIPSKQCDLCNDGFHWRNECPFWAECVERVRKQVACKPASTHAAVFAPNDYSCFSAQTNLWELANTVIIDSGSDVHLFRNQSLLSNLREADEFISLKGVNNSAPRLQITEEGEFAGIKNVYYSSNSSANILSLCLLEQHHKINYQQGRSITLCVDKHKMVFNKVDRKYIYVVNPEQDTLVSTIAENRIGYSKRDIQRAQAAKEFIAKLHHPSEQAVINSIKAGNFNNLDVTEQDVRRAFKIFGPDIYALKGKATAPKPTERLLNNPLLFRDQVNVGTLSVDIMYLEGSYFIMGVLDEIGMAISYNIRKKNRDTIQTAITSMIETCRQHKWEVVVRSDNEPSLVSIANNLLIRDAEFDFVPPGRHVPIVERKLRTIKNKARATISRLPYKVPAFAIKWLVASVVFSENILVNNSGNRDPSDVRSPRELFTGARTDAARDLRIEFGQYAEIYNTNNKIINSMEPRTKAGIALGTKPGSGIYYFWILATNAIIESTHFTECPLNDTIIQRINSQDLQRPGDVTDPVAAPQQPIVEIETSTIAQPITVTQPEAEPTQSASEPENHPAVPETISEPVVITTNDSDPLPTRPRRSNQGVPAQKYADVFNNLTVASALQQFGDIAKDAMTQELQSILDYNCFDIVPPNDAKGKLIRSKMFLKEKFSADGQFEKLKARLVAGGHQQDRSSYTLEETSSPTVSTTSLFTLLALKKDKDKVVTVDIKSAYLNASMSDRVILMKMEP